jgi:hypothetical protein
MLARMDPDPLDLEGLRRAARLAGFEWGDDELRAILPAATAAVRLLASLESVDVGEGEPSTQYRMF